MKTKIGGQQSPCPPKIATVTSVMLCSLVNFLACEDEGDRLFHNISKELPLYAA
jgi:hypothetical protein